MKEGRVYPTRRKRKSEENIAETIEMTRVKPNSPEGMPLVNAWDILNKQNSAFSKWKHYVSTKRESRKNTKRILSERRCRIYENLKEPVAFLDSDMEEALPENMNALESGNDTGVNSQTAQSASNRALLIYFAKLARADPELPTTVVDFEFVDSLLQSGADINVCDRYGQTIFHEASRAWHCDVALFLLEKGADVNRADKYGRTAMHVAAAVDYAEMINFLFENGGKYSAQAKICIPLLWFVHIFFLHRKTQWLKAVFTLVSEK